MRLWQLEISSYTCEIANLNNRGLTQVLFPLLSRMLGTYPTQPERNYLLSARTVSDV
jgi:hypothetical protein